MIIFPFRQIRGTVHQSLTLLDSLVTIADDKVKALCASWSPDLYEAATDLMKTQLTTARQRHEFVGAMLADPNHVLHHYGKFPDTPLGRSDYPLFLILFQVPMGMRP